MITLDNFNDYVQWFLGWPLMIYVLGASIICTFALRGLQFRYFFKAWKVTLFPPVSDSTKHKAVDMSPLQAFVNTLSASIGNGSLAGMATAVYAGGPGAAIWAVIIGFLLMSIRFAEVYISTLYGQRIQQVGLGGPMLYLKDVGGSWLAGMYAFCVIIFGCAVGNAIQANSIRLSLETTWGVPMWLSASLLLLFVGYIVLGGAARIIKASDFIVPIKVGVFFISTIILLVYHYQSLGYALQIMLTGAFNPSALMGGALGFTVQQAVRYGVERSIMATESGLGTAAVLFGFTGSKDPMVSGLMGMLSTFISTIVCFLVALCIVASGVWDSGLTSTALTIAALNTVFGVYGGWIGTFLSISFGMGVMVAFAYITRAAWFYFTDGKYPFVIIAIYCIATGLGAITSVDKVWGIAGMINGLLLLINLFGVIYLLPVVMKHLKK
jgi:AGCS family alanine or glycine:cation symporter